MKYKVATILAIMLAWYLVMIVFAGSSLPLQ